MAKNNRNDYYSKTIEEFMKGKDSVMEMAKIVNYDSDRLVAKVYTLTSKSYQDDVPVFFPSMHLNTGIISPPAKNSTSLLFWGPDRQPFLLPIQFIIPSVKVTNGVNKINASPGVRDRLLSLRNIQSGEHLIRSLGGAYAFFKNMGDLEIGTSRLHRLSLTEKDGALDTIVERIRSEIGNSRLYFGPASMDSDVDERTHFYFEVDENSNKESQIEQTDDETLIESVINDKTDNVQLKQTPKLSTYQFGHVLDHDGNALQDDSDMTDLYSQHTLSKDGNNRTESVSKAGRKVVKTEGPNSSTTVTTSSTEVQVEHERIVDGVPTKTTIGINEEGKIMCGQDGKEYDLMPMLRWFYEDRTQISPLETE